ncbi:MAG TPA: hypothetical protein VEF34_05080 [Syntrophobacteraceae bacterium]|nr:hypothetical protein [Syntrophobacteraceae bacterium]
MSARIEVPGELFSNHWLNKAADDLAGARSDVDAGRLGNAVRRLYFACFHVQEPEQVRVLTEQPERFVKQIESLISTK